MNDYTLRLDKDEISLAESITRHRREEINLTEKIVYLIL